MAAVMVMRRPQGVAMMMGVMTMMAAYRHRVMVMVGVERLCGGGQGDQARQGGDGGERQQAFLHRFSSFLRRARNAAALFPRPSATR